MTLSNKKIFQLVTVSKSIPLMKGQIEYLRDKGLDVHVVSSKGPEQNTYSSDITHVVNMEREISLKNDLKSLMNMIRLFKKEKPHIVNSGTPKAGLIGTLAAFITRRPVRIYTVRGLRLETATGFKYKILYAMEKLAMFCATDIIAISDSLKNTVIDLKLAKAKKVKVLGYGSSNGLNLTDYNLSKKSLKSSISNSLKNYLVIGYIGRVVKDKGIHELIDAFKIIQKDYKVKLLVIGSIEKGNPIDYEYFNYLKTNENVILLDHVKNPVNYYNNMDVFVFPTYREGFGNVSIEAQALKVPVITTDVTGAKDTVIDGKTGYLVNKGNVLQIVDKLKLLLDNEELRDKLGNNGRKRVFEMFSNEVIWRELENLYKKKINGR